MGEMSGFPAGESVEDERDRELLRLIARADAFNNALTQLEVADESAKGDGHGWRDDVRRFVYPVLEAERNRAQEEAESLRSRLGS